MAPTETMEVLRRASKGERRNVMRHALGYYRAVIVTGRYVQQLKANNSDTIGIDTFIPALKHCIATHPILSAGIRGEETESPDFVRPSSLDLRKHIEICVAPTDMAADAKAEDDLVKEVLIRTHDQLFPDVEHIPPWRIVVLPSQATSGASERRLYIMFAFAHSHGDGKSGLAFHRAFINGLEHGRTSYDANPIHSAPSRALPPSLEEACKLKITIPYLLGPLLGAYLPKFIPKMLNLPPSYSPHTPETWTGTPAVFDPKTLQTGLEIIDIDKEAINGILVTCRSHEAKFTGLLHQIIVRALSEAIPKDAPAGNFVAGTAVDLRSLVPGLSDDDMTLCVSSVMEAYPRVDSVPGNTGEQSEGDLEAVWAEARRSTARLASGAGTLVNQPVGLLRYLSKMRPWLEGQIGQPHDSSYEISNILAFDPFAKDKTDSASTQSTKSWDVDKMYFSQPGNPTSCPLSFQVVSRKGGPMTITVIWQVGTLGVPDENAFVTGIAGSIKARLLKVALKLYKNTSTA